MIAAGETFTTDQAEEAKAWLERIHFPTKDQWIEAALKAIHCRDGESDPVARQKWYREAVEFGIEGRKDFQRLIEDIRRLSVFGRFLTGKVSMNDRCRILGSRQGHENAASKIVDSERWNRILTRPQDDPVSLTHRAKEKTIEATVAHDKDNRTHVVSAVVIEPDRTPIRVSVGYIEQPDSVTFARASALVATERSRKGLPEVKAVRENSSIASGVVTLKDKQMHEVGRLKVGKDGALRVVPITK